MEEHELTIMPQLTIEKRGNLGLIPEVVGYLSSIAVPDYIYTDYKVRHPAGVFNLATYYVVMDFIELLNELEENQRNYNNANKSVLINVMTITGIEDPTLKEISVYPNPTKGLLTLDGLSSVSNDKTVSLMISDNFGKTILVKPLEKNIKSLTIDISRFDSGVYFIVLQTDKERIVKQFVKQ